MVRTTFKKKHVVVKRYKMRKLFDSKGNPVYIKSLKR